MFLYDPTNPWAFPIITILVSTLLWGTSLIIVKCYYKKKFRGFLLLASFIYGFFLSFPFDTWKIGAPNYFKYIEAIMFGLPSILSFFILIFDSIFYIKDGQIIRRRKMIKDPLIIISFEYLFFGMLSFLSGLLRF